MADSIPYRRRETGLVPCEVLAHLRIVYGKAHRSQRTRGQRMPVARGSTRPPVSLLSPSTSYVLLCALCLSGCTALPAPAVPDEQVIFHAPAVPDALPEAPPLSVITGPSTSEPRLTPPALLPAPAPASPGKPRKPGNPDGLIQKANKASRVQPSRQNYVGDSAIQRYIYQPGKIYDLVSSPNHPSLVMLPPGERLAATPIVNPEEWELAAVEAGDGETRQETLIVRPFKAGLTATMPLICQSGRAYFVLLRSTERTSMAAITWQLPAVQVLTPEPSPQQSVAGMSVFPRTGRKAAPQASPPLIAVDRVHTAYTMETVSGAPPWVPLATWDDGAKVVIHFRQSLQYTVAPAVFAVGHDGKPGLVEMTPYEDGDPTHGAYYVVSGLYPVLTLRDGQGNEVRITRVTGRATPYAATSR